MFSFDGFGFLSKIETKIISRKKVERKIRKVRGESMKQLSIKMGK